MGLNELDMSRSSKYVPRTANALVEIKSKVRNIFFTVPDLGLGLKFPKQA